MVMIFKIIIIKVLHEMTKQSNMITSKLCGLRNVVNRIDDFNLNDKTVLDNDYNF